MTMIRLDAATVAELQAAGDGPVVLADEAGRPVAGWVARRLAPLDQEPKHTPDEWRAIIDNPVRYTTAEVVERVRRAKGA